jgi:hypothetical protein
MLLRWIYYPSASARDNMNKKRNKRGCKLNILNICVFCQAGSVVPQTIGVGNVTPEVHTSVAFVNQRTRFGTGKPFWFKIL